MAGEHISGNARIRTSVINEFIRQKVEPIYRKDAFMAMLKAKGRLTNKHSSDTIEWRPRFRRRTIRAGDGNPVSISFPQTNTKKIAKLPYRNYNLGESYTKFEQLASRGKEHFFQVAQDAIAEMVEDFLEDFRFKLYLDGNAGEAKDLHGLESWFGTTGAVISNGKCGNPSDTYAELNTALGTYGGDWDADSGDAWPTGTGDTEYGFWTPVVVDYNNAGFTATTTHNWREQWQQSIRYALTYGELLQRQSYDLILLNPELLRIAKDSLEDIQQLEITQSSDLTKVGFKTLQFDGHELVTEYGVPSGVGYLLSFDALELMSMQDGLVGRMSDEDISTATQLRAIDFYGNLRCKAPSFTAKLAAISEETSVA